MSVFGVWQLQRLKFFFCEVGGSSRGARDYIGNILPKFIKDNPHIQCEVNIKRGHPFAFAEYLNGNSRLVDFKNKTTEEISRHVYYLRNSTGRRTHKKIMRHKTETPSIQGKWTPWTVDPTECRKPPKYALEKELEISEEEKDVIVPFSR